MATSTLSTDATSSDPKVAASALDFLLIELVPLAQRIAADLHARDTALLSQRLDRDMTLNVSTAAVSGTKRQSVKSEAGRAEGSLAGTTGRSEAAREGGPQEDEDEDEDEEEADQRREDVLYRLDALGYRVGLGLVEKSSANTPRPTTPLDMIKFICKDLWTLLFRHQIDNLKTNHRGTFVLTDNKFPPLSRISVDRSRGPTKGLEEALRNAQPFLWFPCGVIRGALAGFGLSVSVQAETGELPQAVFQIRTTTTVGGGKT
ncbi:transport protein particle component [Aureobasidium subglaciale]|nr:transport protein particle component [Aureobasidium subglaciale]